MIRTLEFSDDEVCAMVKRSGDQVIAALRASTVEMPKFNDFATRARQQWRPRRRDEVEVTIGHLMVGPDGVEDTFDCLCVCTIIPGEIGIRRGDPGDWTPDFPPQAEITSSTVGGKEVDLNEIEREAAHNAAIEAYYDEGEEP
jgi:hypothetical protein